MAVARIHGAGGRTASAGRPRGRDGSATAEEREARKRAGRVNKGERNEIRSLEQETSIS